MKTGEIIEAIRNRCCLIVHYGAGERLIEPHAIGRSKDSNLLLRAYQVSGASASGQHEYWKLFRIDRMSKIEFSQTPSCAPRPGYKISDPVMKGGIIAEV